MADTTMPPNDIARQARSRFFFDPKTGEITHKARQDAPAWWNEKYVGMTAGRLCNNGYVYVSTTLVKGRTAILAHRLAWLLYYGRWPYAVVDHINGVRDDNRITNLRDITFAENLGHRNGKVRAKSGVRGVHRQGQSWRAFMGRTFLGSFRTIEEAAEARAEEQAARAIKMVDFPVN